VTLIEYRQAMSDLGFHVSDDGNRMNFTIKAVMGSDHNVRIRVEKHPQGWWQCTFTDGWETTFLDKTLLKAFDLVRQFAYPDDQP
jgi:hypothetical protein